MKLWVSSRVLATVNHGALGGSRTPDLLVRSQALYPTELPARDEGRIIRMRPYAVNFESNNSEDV